MSYIFLALILTLSSKAPNEPYAHTEQPITILDIKTTLDVHHIRYAQTLLQRMLISKFYQCKEDDIGINYASLCNAPPCDEVFKRIITLVTKLLRNTITNIATREESIPEYRIDGKIDNEIDNFTQSFYNAIKPDDEKLLQKKSLEVITFLATLHLISQYTAFQNNFLSSIITQIIQAIKHYEEYTFFGPRLNNYMPDLCDNLHSFIALLALEPLKTSLTNIKIADNPIKETKNIIEQIDSSTSTTKNIQLDALITSYMAFQLYDLNKIKHEKGTGAIICFNLKELYHTAYRYIDNFIDTYSVWGFMIEAVILILLLTDYIIEHV